jgi:hypothetical protein
MSRLGKMGYQNKHNISIDDKTWDNFLKLQRITGKTKAQLIREMLDKALSNFGNSWTNNSEDLKQP